MIVTIFFEAGHKKMISGQKTAFLGPERATLGNRVQGRTNYTIDFGRTTKVPSIRPYFTGHMGNGHGLHPREHLERVSTTLKEELPSTLAATTGWEQLEKTGTSARGMNGSPLHWF